MAWQQWVFVIVAIAATTSVISAVGEQRDPVTPKAAAAIFVIWSLLIALVVSI